MVTVVVDVLCVCSCLCVHVCVFMFVCSCLCVHVRVYTCRENIEHERRSNTREDRIRREETKTLFNVRPCKITHPSRGTHYVVDQM